ncbi:hypothetical protein GA0061098_101992 [Bradyrhizobium shewense]|uniref:Uncharacterized protein n=1 Tax=Bradyrhizobium shewense TaxID=1761772 RepID=A0A1C3XMH3_9BRAD|nr:hypothetical protein GA0061098_101992 [Bradyrhizobium shewense]
MVQARVALDQIEKRSRVPDALQRATLLRRAGTQKCDKMGPGSAERHYVPHRVRDTKVLS